VPTAAAPRFLFPARASAARTPGSPTKGDIAILQFLAAAEILETDLWQQYNELGGEEGGNQALPACADQRRRRHCRTTSTQKHRRRGPATRRFLNAYLESKGAAPVNPGRVPDAPEQPGDGRPAGRAGSRTLMSLKRRHQLLPALPQPAATRTFGATFPQVVNIQGEPAIR